MKLLIVLVTFNRLNYTKKTLRSLWGTIEVPYYLVVVDNSSTDGTKPYLERLLDRGRIDRLILNDDNRYPGAACNQGWAEGLKDYQATHLMRLDNDMHFEKGWDTKAAEYFDKIDRLGQLGLEYDAIVGFENLAEEHNGMLLNPHPGNVGGPNIIKRAIFDGGLRYNEDKWHAINPNIPTPQEDVRFSHQIKEHGYLVGHMTDRLAWTFANESNWKDYPDYYRKTFSERGYGELLEKI